MQIRAAQATDTTAIAELFTAAIHRLGQPFYGPQQLRAWAPDPPDLDYWGKRLAGLEVRVAEIHVQIAGFVGFHDDGHIDLIFVHPNHARAGIATALLTHAERELVAAGVTAFRTEASEAARGFFERNGFEVAHRETVSIRDVAIGRYVMHKR